MTRKNCIGKESLFLKEEKAQNIQNRMIFHKKIS